MTQLVRLCFFADLKTFAVYSANLIFVLQEKVEKEVHIWNQTCVYMQTAACTIDRSAMLAQLQRKHQQTEYCLRSMYFSDVWEMSLNSQSVENDSVLVLEKRFGRITDEPLRRCTGSTSSYYPPAVMTCVTGPRGFDKIPAHTQENPIMRRMDMRAHMCVCVSMKN